jgi:NAD(P)-dependent dehydrogenase (short-subunit alcohol dehydrogenase family)
MSLKAEYALVKRSGHPADIGNVVALLCREEARWITGRLVAADGGTR